MYTSMPLTATSDKEQGFTMQWLIAATSLRNNLPFTLTDRASKLGSYMRSFEHILEPRLRIGLVSIAATLISTASLSGAIVWQWSYNTTGIVANGTLTTVDVPDVNGGFLITAISGARNGVAITGLQDTDTAIPGNEPFAVDNLLFAGPRPQLTGDGFGFSLANGNYANAFFADFLATPSYLEFLSSPPFTAGAAGPEDSEGPIDFSATPVPEPATYLMAACALVGLALRRRRVVGRFPNGDLTAISAGNTSESREETS